MNNREIIEKVVAAFDDNDSEAILSYMTADIEWHMIGDEVISGKEAMKATFNMDMKMISSTKKHFIADGDQVMVDGEVVCGNEKGEQIEMYYCDIYELENGKVRKMYSYVINNKK